MKLCFLVNGLLSLPLYLYPYQVSAGEGGGGSAAPPTCLQQGALSIERSAVQAVKPEAVCMPAVQRSTSALRSRHTHIALCFCACSRAAQPVGCPARPVCRGADGRPALLCRHKHSLTGRWGKACLAWVHRWRPRARHHLCLSNYVAGHYTAPFLLGAALSPCRVVASEQSPAGCAIVAVLVPSVWKPLKLLGGTAGAAWRLGRGSAVGPPAALWVTITLVRQ